MNRTTAALALGVLSMSAPADGQSSGWAQWRGPDRDGAVTSFTPPGSWPEQLTRRWQVEVGLGYGTPLVVGDRVYLHTHVDGDEVTTALDAVTGEAVWRESYVSPYQMNPAAARHGRGPKSTPALSDGKLFTLGLSGILSGLDAETGEVLWRREAPAVGPIYGTGMSPIVDGDRLIAHVGGHDRGSLVAFDTETGDVHWSWNGDGPSYASPIIATVAGTRQLITYTQSNLVGLDVATGELLWGVPFTTRLFQNIITPIIYGDVVISSGLDNGVSALRVTRRGTQWNVEPIWENADVSFYMSNPVRIEDAIYGLSHLNSGQFVCLDVTTGATLWATEGRQATNAAVVRAGDLLFLLSDEAELIVARASRSGFEPLQRYPVADSPTWAQPAIVGDRIYIKDDSTLALWSIP